MKDTTTGREPRLDHAASGVAVSLAQMGQDVSETDISHRAYERFLECGAEYGHDLDDWLEAERELRRPAASQVA